MISFLKVLRTQNIDRVITARQKEIPGLVPKPDPGKSRKASWKR